MKILRKKETNIVIFGTNNNNAQIVIDGPYITIDSVRIYGLTDYDIIEDNSIQLPNPFFVGYQTFVDGVFEFTPNYLAWNTKAFPCIKSVQDEYVAKSKDPVYSQQERDSFAEYASSLDPIFNITYIDPGFQVPIPPDEDYVWQPACMIGPEV